MPPVYLDLESSIQLAGRFCNYSSKMMEPPKSKLIRRLAVDQMFYLIPIINSTFSMVEVPEIS